MATVPGTHKRPASQLAMSPKSMRSMAITITVLMCVFMIINFADKSAIGFAGTAIIEELQISPEQFGVVQSSFFWLFPIGAVVIASLTKWISTRWLLPVLMLAWMLTMIPLLSPVSFTVLVVCRVLLGFAEGPAYALANHLIFSWFPPEKRNLPTSMLATGGAAGPLISAPILTWVIATWSWHAQFIILIGVGAAWIAVWLVLGKNPPASITKGGPIDIHASINAAADAELSDDRVARLLITPTVIGVGLLTFVAYWVVTLRVSWLPLYMEQALGLGTLEAGRLIMIPLGASVVLPICVAAVSNLMIARGVSLRLARGGLCSICAVVSGIAFIFMPMVGTGALGMVLASIAFSVVPATFGISLPIIGDFVAAKRRGAVMGWIVAFYSFAGVLAPLALGAAVGRFAESLATGYGVGFATCGIVVLVGGVLASFMIDPKRDLAKLKAKSEARSSSA